METATPEIEKSAKGNKAETKTVEPQDPEHDINARATVVWVLAWTVILFVGLWVMLQLFDAVLFTEREAKIGTLAPTERQQLLEQERVILSGQWEEGAPRKSIEEVMREMARDER